VAQDVGRIVAAVADVDGDGRAAEPGRREPGEGELRAVAQHHRDAVARVDPAVQQRRGDRVAAGVDVAVRHIVTGLGEDPGDPVRPSPRGRGDEARQRVGHR